MARFFYLAILKPGFKLTRLFQNQGRFQNGQVNGRFETARVSKRPGTYVLLPCLTCLATTDSQYFYYIKRKPELDQGRICGQMQDVSTRKGQLT